jgi:hypothetical protein
MNPTPDSITDETPSTYENAPANVSSSVSSSTGNPALIDPDLAMIVQRWPDTPGPIKAGILAMVRAAIPGNVELTK